MSRLLPRLFPRQVRAPLCGWPSGCPVALFPLCMAPLLPQRGLTFLLLILSISPTRWLPRFVQRQWEMHTGSEQLAVCLPDRLERARMQRCHGNLLCG
ncbi:hypothetical protein J1605_016939 [Eschrichtius robustus]|uniref:Uncharacterized protein n=1 Tax=Eschrichtius robustus TaxID=9764 RepID=A0AB34HZ31_ESCRO|nr:hypothetical protein J1605_016939 [Eschrichtius robustus]